MTVSNTVISGANSNGMSKVSSSSPVSSDSSQTLSSNRLVIVSGVTANVLCVVGIVILNKYILETDGYRFMLFLSFLHFLVTAISTRVLLASAVFTYKDAALVSVLPVALGSLLSVGFMNLNLAANSVGFYQVSKLACIPFTLLVQFVVYQQTVSYKVLATLVPIILGVGVATVYDLSLNFIGTVFAVCAVVATSMSQIFTNTYQKHLQCDALQLLYHTAPLISVGMLAMSPIFDNTKELRQFEYTPGVVTRIGLSCLLAVGVNVSNYLVLGKTSPLTYQVLGHLKTVMIIVLGFVFFHKAVDNRNLIGVTIAMTGVIAYTEVKRREQESPRGNGTNQSKTPLPESERLMVDEDVEDNTSIALQDMR